MNNNETSSKGMGRAFVVLLVMSLVVFATSIGIFTNLPAIEAVVFILLFFAVPGVAVYFIMRYSSKILAKGITRMFFPLVEKSLSRLLSPLQPSKQ